MFDSPANRFRYEKFKERHDEMMVKEGREGQSYRRGFGGEPYYQQHDDYEAWRAGRANREDVQ